MPIGVYNHYKIRGHKFNLGRILSENHKKKISLSNKKIIHTEEWNKKVSKSNIGKKMSNIARTKMSLARKGKVSNSRGKHWKLSEEIKKRIGDAVRNRPKKDRNLLKRYGDANRDRRSSAYSYWRLEVFKRDNYKCKMGNCDCRGKIIAHHILSYTKFPELRFNINNGITLCQFHHPLKRKEEQRLIPFFQSMVEVIRT